MWNIIIKLVDDGSPVWEPIALETDVEAPLGIRVFFESDGREWPTVMRQRVFARLKQFHPNLVELAGRHWIVDLELLASTFGIETPPPDLAGDLRLNGKAAVIPECDLVVGSHPPDGLLRTLCLDFHAVTLRSPTQRRLAAMDLSVVANQRLRAVLLRNLHELGAAIDNSMHTSAVVLAGSIGEGVLYDALVARKPRAMAAKAAPGGNQHPTDVEAGNWTLVNYINVATELGVVGKTVGAMAHGVLREFRNLIHPKKQVTMNVTLDSAEAESALLWLEALVRDVARATS